MHCGEDNERPAGGGERRRRKPGSAAGKVVIYDDFHDPPPDGILELFHEGSILPDESPEGGSDGRKRSSARAVGG